MRPKPCVRWYRKAAEQGDSKGQNGLGRCYEHGLGVPKDLAAAAQWYRIAAGDARQRNGEARGLHAAFGQAFPDADAQYNIGRCFAYGLGVKRDFAEAMRWFRASSVHPYAHYELGRCYEEGRGVSKDLDRAAEWYRKSAKSCATWDQYSNYGAMVEKDIQQRLHRIAEIKVEGDANVANAAAGKSGDESSTVNNIRSSKGTRWIHFYRSA